MLMATEEPKCACKGKNGQQRAMELLNFMFVSFFFHPNNNKGVRRCLVCDADHVAQATSAHLSKDNYIYCLECGDRAIAAGQFQLHVARTHRGSGGGGEEANKDAEEFIAIDGVFLQEEVLTADEESRLVRSIDSFAWVDSQSGRRKQDFGPKINFKKKKLNLASFEGLPSLDVQLFELVKRHRLKLHEHSQRFQFANNDDFHFADEVGCDNILKNFHSVEICHLEYWWVFCLHFDHVTNSLFTIAVLVAVPRSIHISTIFGSGASGW